MSCANQGFSVWPLVAHPGTVPSVSVLSPSLPTSKCWHLVISTTFSQLSFTSVPYQEIFGCEMLISHKNKIFSLMSGSVILLWVAYAAASGFFSHFLDQMSK